MSNCIKVIVALIFLIPLESKSISYLLEQKEIVFVFNQPDYTPGDTAFFAASLHGFPAQMTKGKRVIGISLIDNQNEIRYFNRTVFENGTGNGQLILPGDLLPGGYWLVADIEGFNTKASMKTRFVVSGEFNYRSEEQISTDSFQGEVVLDSNSPGRRQPVHVKFSPVEDSPEGEIRVSVIKESLFSDNRQAPSAIFRLVASDDMEHTTTSNPYLFRGSARFQNSKKIVPDSTQLVFYLNNNDFIFQVFTNSNGDFSFPLFKNFPNEEVFFSAFRNGVRVDSVTLDIDLFKYSGDKINVTPTRIENPFFRYNLKLKAIDDSYKYFTNKEKGNSSQRLDWWPEVDYEVNLERLEPFNTIEEVFQNVISMVRYRKSPTGDGIRVFLKKETQYAAEDPLFIIDGTMTDNLNYFINLDPIQVKRIGICRTHEILARYGLLGKNGIVVVETTNGALPLKERTDKSFFVTGISRAYEFNGSSVSQDKRVPILKSCLYWNPGLVKNDKGNYEFTFLTSDDLGSYLIQFTYVDKDGRIFTRNERVRVSP